MQYYEDNGRAGKRAGIVAAAAYVVLWVVLMFVVSITLHTEDTGEGILIDFGDTGQAGGSMADAQPQPTEDHSPADTPPVTSPEDMMTQDYEEAPEIARPQPRPEPRPSESEQPDRQQTASPAAEQPRVPDQRAMFPGSNRQGNDTSQGVGEGDGRQGSQAGTPGADPAGTGAGNEGVSYDLHGRDIVGEMFKPENITNKVGHVIVDIIVDATGKVVLAKWRAIGSNIQDNRLVNASIDAAYKTKFDVAKNGDGTQNGTITYNFIWN